MQARNRQINFRLYISLACGLLIGIYLLVSIYLLSGLTGTSLFYKSGVHAGADFLQIWAASSLVSGGDSASVYNAAELT
jgi:hypothetical protein